MRSQTIILLTVKMYLLSNFISDCSGARILTFFPFGTKSHKIAADPILEALAARGHQVSIISSFKSKIPVENIHDIEIGGIAALMKHYEEVLGFEFDWFALARKDGIEALDDMMKDAEPMFKFAYDDLMNSTQLQTILKERNVDLVIVDCFNLEFILPIIESLGVPYVYHCSSYNLPWVADLLEMLGGGYDFASVPYPMTVFNGPMTFWQRLYNIRIGHKFRSTRLRMYELADAYTKKDFPNGRPTFDLHKEVSLVLVNTQLAVDYPRALPPTVIPIGAPHTRPAKPLPSPLKEITDDAKEGFILFTLGSFLQVKVIPKDILQTFIRVFGRFANLKILWKWEMEEPKDLPSNIKLVDWLPQQDLLGHPNIKLFISHCGMLGTQERIYHGVPVLGLPFGHDQKTNIGIAEKDGTGLKLEWDDINEDSLYTAIHRLIYDPSFKANATRISGLMRDEIMPGIDVAVYWIEHVIRHGGTKHLQLAAKSLPFYQRYFLDIILVFSVIILLPIICLFVTCRFLYVQCLGKNLPKRKTN